MTPVEIRLRVLEALVSKAPQSPDPQRLIDAAEVLLKWIETDNPPKRGPGRPPKQSIDADND